MNPFTAASPTSSLARRLLGLARRAQWAMVAAALMLPLILSSTAMAQQFQDRETWRDADGRLWGYDRGAGTVAIEEASTVPAYLVLLILTVIAIGVMFKSANRTHLD